MGIYTNYPDSIYDNGGGVGGESSFFKDSFALPGALAFDSDNKRIYPFFPGNVGGGVSFPKNFAPDGLNKFYLKLVFSKKITSGGSPRLFNYRSPTSAYDQGRFFAVELNESGQLILLLADSKESFGPDLILKNGVQSGKHSIIVSLDQKNFSLKFDEEALFSSVVEDYTNGFYSPTIGCEPVYANVFPQFYFFHPGDYIDASETKMNINGNDILGF